jgi:hypothetical protein
LSLFLIVSDAAREGLTTLLPLLGATKQQVAWIWNEEAEALRESIRQAISDRKPWSIYEDRPDTQCLKVKGNKERTHA